MADETTDVYEFGGSTEWALLGWMRLNTARSI